MASVNRLFAHPMCRPQYWEIYRRKEVIGISIVFMAVDISGGVFLILSLVFKDTFDVFASIAYMVVIASHLFFSLVSTVGPTQSSHS